MSERLTMSKAAARINTATDTEHACNAILPCPCSLPGSLLREHPLGAWHAAWPARVCLAGAAQRARKRLERRLNDVVAVAPRQLRGAPGSARRPRARIVTPRALRMCSVMPEVLLSDMMKCSTCDPARQGA